MEYRDFIPEEMERYFKSIYKANDKRSLEEILIAFKKMGYSQMQALVLLVEEMKISITEANDIILDSKASNTDFDQL